MRREKEGGGGINIGYCVGLIGVMVGVKDGKATQDGGAKDWMQPRHVGHALLALGYATELQQVVRNHQELSVVQSEILPCPHNLLSRNSDQFLQIPPPVSPIFCGTWIESDYCSDELIPGMPLRLLKRLPHIRFLYVRMSDSIGDCCCVGYGGLGCKEADIVKVIG